MPKLIIVATFPLLYQYIFEHGYEYKLRPAWDYNGKEMRLLCIPLDVFCEVADAAVFEVKRMANGDVHFEQIRVRKAFKKKVMS